VLDDLAADGRAEHEPDPDERGGHHVAAIVAVRVRALAAQVRQRDDRDAHQPAAAEALDGAERDQLADRVSPGAQRRAGEEETERGQEHAARAEPVGELAVQRLHAGAGERVRGDQPRDLADAAGGVQVTHDRRGRGGDDRLVEDRQQERCEARSHRSVRLGSGHPVKVNSDKN